VFDSRGDDVIATVAPCKVCTFERQIIGLASAACEDNFIIFTAKQRRHLPARPFQGGVGRCGGPMPARRVAKVIRKKRLHRGRDRGINGRTGVVIEIDAPHVQNT
jgi:hypothetical protein